LHIVTKIKAMQTVIENCQKLTALLIEYREAKIYEKCLYHVVSQSDRQNMFFLVEIKTGTIKRNGTPLLDARKLLQLTEIIHKSVECGKVAKNITSLLNRIDNK